MATIEVQEPVEEQEQQDTNTETDTEVKDEVDEQEESTEDSEKENGESDEDAKEPAPKEDEKADESKALEESLKATKESVDEAAKTLSEKGIDYNALTQEYEEKGVLSDETYKKLADAGYPKAVVDTYIRGIEAVNEGFATAVYAAAGGKEEYGKLAKYIESKGQEAVDGFNDAVMNGSLSTVKMLLAGFKAEMTLRNGTQKASVLGGGTGANTSGFANEAAMEKAMDDPRYGVDEEYTKMVTKRLSKSKFFSFGR